VVSYPGIDQNTHPPLEGVRFPRVDRPDPQIPRSTQMHARLTSLTLPCMHWWQISAPSISRQLSSRKSPPTFISFHTLMLTYR